MLLKKRSRRMKECDNCNNYKPRKPKKRWQNTWEIRDEDFRKGNGTLVFWLCLFFPFIAPVACFYVLDTRKIFK